MRYKQDLHDFLNEHLECMAESHLDGWASRYRDYSVSDLEFDLAVNHDDSLEIEEAELELERDLTSEETKYLCKKFHEEVVRQFRDKLLEKLK